MFEPGDIIRFRHLVEDEPTTSCICRSASTYGYGLDLELRPLEDRLYVVCQGDETKGYTLMDLDDKEKPIGYIISSRGYRISQVGFEWEPIEIIKIGDYKYELPHITPIGSHVFIV